MAGLSTPPLWQQFNILEMQGFLKFVKVLAILASGLKPNPSVTAKILLHIMHTASPIWLFAATNNSQTAFFYSQWLIWRPCGEPQEIAIRVMKVKHPQASKKDAVETGDIETCSS